MIRRRRSLPQSRPTPAEMEILGVLWELGPSTVRDVVKMIEKRKATHYTTVLKLMQIMHQKGLVARDEKGKAHIYRVAQKQELTQKNAVSDLLEKVFSGSAAKLVQHVLETKSASREELAEIRRMISEAEARAENE